MSLFKNQYSYVQEELKNLPEFDDLPKGKLKNFTSKISYALSLGLKEKEIFFFGLMQWASILFAYLLWVQMLAWIPQPVWDQVSECDGEWCSWRIDIPLMLWGLLCIFLAAFPIGIFSSAMGTAHFLHKNGEESTVVKCLTAAFSNAFATWNFHFVDGYITVMQILERLPSENDNRSAITRAADEALYYIWKIGIAGVLPSLVLGNSVIESGKNSIQFVKANFLEVAKLRAAYSLLCWIVGILGYVGGMVVIFLMGDKIYALSGGLAIPKIYNFMVFPIAIAVSVVMIFLRPIYILTICDLYSDFLKDNDKKASLPANPSNGRKAFILFIIVCFVVAIVAGFREEIGLLDLLSSLS